MYFNSKRSAAQATAGWRQNQRICSSMDGYGGVEFIEQLHILNVVGSSTLENERVVAAVKHGPELLYKLFKYQKSPCLAG
jgi:hypothetical protein